MEDKRWFRFMATDQWVVFMNVMRIFIFVLMLYLIFTMTQNIEEVKTIANPCTMCTEKTGAVCMIRQGETDLGEFNLANISISIQP